MTAEGPKQLPTPKAQKVSQAQTAWPCFGYVLSLCVVAFVTVECSLAAGQAGPLSTGSL